MAPTYRPYGMIGDDGTISRLPQSLPDGALGVAENEAVDSGNAPMEVDQTVRT
jgi:hypothetical protein